MIDLPKKALFRADEVRDYFGISMSTVYNWIDRGLLKSEKYCGIVRITRESIIELRAESKVEPEERYALK